MHAVTTPAMSVNIPSCTFVPAYAVKVGQVINPLGGKPVTVANIIDAPAGSPLGGAVDAIYFTNVVPGQQATRTSLLVKFHPLDMVHVG